MVKTHTNLTIDFDVLKQAKERFFNMSQIAEDAIKEKLGKKEVEINMTITECEFCDEEPKGLTWLFPDERWICNKCLIRKGRRILK